MNNIIDLYLKCHQGLGELYNKRQIPLFNIDNEVHNRLVLDGTIRKNGINVAITPKGDELYQNKYYLELAAKAGYEEREKELKERDSLMNQLSVEKAYEQNVINRQMLFYQKIIIVFSGIAAIGTIFGLIKGCN